MLDTKNYPVCIRASYLFGKEPVFKENEKNNQLQEAFTYFL